MPGYFLKILLVICICLTLPNWFIKATAMNSPQMVLGLNQESKPSRFTVHIFIDHDPYLAAVFLPELFSTFPTSLWKPPPLQVSRPRPTVEPDAGFRLGPDAGFRLPPRTPRYILPRPVSASTALADVYTMFQQEFAVPSKYVSHFTIIPQGYLPDGGGYPEWNNRPLPWDMTLAEAQVADFDLLDSRAFDAEKGITVPETDAPELHLVIETKAAALNRITGTKFLTEALGDFFHYRPPDAGEIQSALRFWRMGHYAEQYRIQQRVKGVEGIDDEMEQILSRLKELPLLIEQAKAGEKATDRERFKLETEEWGLKSRIGVLERGANGGRRWRQDLSAFVAIWNTWVRDGRYEEIEYEELQDEEIETEVMAVLVKRHEIIEGWRSSMAREEMEAAVREEYFAIRPWMTDEERQTEMDRRDADRKRKEDMRAMQSNNQASRSKTTETVEDVNRTAEEPSSIRAFPFRYENGSLLKHVSDFNITSGILLWGQMLPMFTSTLASNLTENAARAPPNMPGGTIIQHRFSYKSAARNGKWKVRRYTASWHSGHLGWSPDEPMWNPGWIVFHESVDPMSILKKARSLDGISGGALSNRNMHTDKVKLCSSQSASPYTMLMLIGCPLHWTI
jgi:hypothetical protein